MHIAGCILLSYSKEYNKLKLKRSSIMKKVIVVFAVLALVSGCGNSGSPADPQSESDASYYPLSVGNQWVYDRSGTMTVAGIQTGTVNGANVTDITDQVPHSSGFNVYVQEINLCDTLETAGQTIISDSTYTTYLRVADEGFFSYLSLIVSDSASFVPFPLQVGATWQFSQDPPITGEILSLSETVSVPAGTFDDCLEIRFSWIEDGQTVQNTSDFAPCVGRVRNVYIQSYEAVVTTLTEVLLSYSVD
jgi:uncharacterized protein YceK